MNTGACVCWCKQVAMGWMSAENTTEAKQQWYFFLLLGLTMELSLKVTHK